MTQQQHWLMTLGGTSPMVQGYQCVVIHDDEINEHFPMI